MKKKIVVLAFLILFATAGFAVQQEVVDVYIYTDTQTISATHGYVLVPPLECWFNTTLMALFLGASITTMLYRYFYW